MAQRTYCTSSDVQKYLPDNVTVEGANPTPNPFNPDPDSIPAVNIDFYIQQACQDIDAALATQYDVPLKQVNQGGMVAYPNPIPMIAALLASEMIYEQKLQGADRQRSDTQKEREKGAHEQLMKIQNGEIRLLGQRNTRGSRFVNSRVQNVPHNPAEGGRSQGAK